MSLLKKIIYLSNPRHGGDWFGRYRGESFKRLCLIDQIECELRYGLAESEFLIRDVDLILIDGTWTPKAFPAPYICLLTQQDENFDERVISLRNLLTYDAFICETKALAQRVADVLFGAGKINCPVLVGAVNYYTNTTFQQRWSTVRSPPACVITEPPPHRRRLLRILFRLARAREISLYMDLRRKPNYISSVPPTLELYTRAVGCSALNLIVGPQGNIDGTMDARLRFALDHGQIPILEYTAYNYAACGDRAIYFHPSDLENYVSFRHFVRSCKGGVEGENRQFLEDVRDLSNLSTPEKPYIDLKMVQTVFSTLVKDKYTVKRHLKYSGDLIDQPSVSYVIRTGGNPRYLERCLHSLKSQNYENIVPILVLYRQLENRNEIVDILRRNFISFKVIDDFGGKRSTGIVTGLKSVQTDYFGILDDDDTVHPNHLATLLNSLDHYNTCYKGNRFRLVYSGSHFYSPQGGLRESCVSRYGQTYFTTGNYALEHFRFYDVDAMRRNCWYMMSNAWLADSSLIPELESDIDSNTNTHEDLYFEHLFARRTSFIFSCEVTAEHHMHGRNSTFVDTRQNPRDKRTHLARLLFGKYNLSGMFSPETIILTKFGPSINYKIHRTENILMGLSFRSRLKIFLSNKIETFVTRGRLIVKALRARGFIGL